MTCVLIAGMHTYSSQAMHVLLNCQCSPAFITTHVQSLMCFQQRPQYLPAVLPSTPLQLRAEVVGALLAVVAFATPSLEKRLQDLQPGRGRAMAAAVEGATNSFALQKSLSDKVQQVGQSSRSTCSTSMHSAHAIGMAWLHGSGSHALHVKACASSHTHARMLTSNCRSSHGHPMLSFATPIAAPWWCSPGAKWPCAAGS